MNKIEIFTDGSCVPNPGRGGWAFTALQDGREIHSANGADPQSTNNRMELTAAIRAVQWADESGFAPGSVRILTDSRYVEGGVRKWLAKGKVKSGTKNRDLWIEAVAAFSLTPVPVSWVRGHNGLKGNERADELAEHGRKSISKTPARVMTSIPKIAQLFDLTGERAQAAQMLFKHHDIDRATLQRILARCATTAIRGGDRVDWNRERGNSHGD